jgi:hypothetical protein
MTPSHAVTGLAAVCALGAAAASTIDLLQGADPRWTAAANLFLVPPAALLAAWAWRTATLPYAVLAALGVVVVAPLGAVLGDRAGSTSWWLAVEAAWWTGVAVVAWRSRPGLAVLTAMAAVAAFLAAALMVLGVPEPVASAAGLRIPMTIVWATWVAVDLVLRPTPAGPFTLDRSRQA